MSKNYELMIFIIGILIITTFFLYQSIIHVPDLTGQSLDEASQTLAKEGLTYDYTLEKTNDSSKFNKVISRSPDFIISFIDSKTVHLVLGTSMREFKIIEPSNGSNQSGDFITVKGTVNNLKSNENIYVLVQPLPLSAQNKTYEWYVQYPVIIDGTLWNCQCQIGRYTDVGRDFKITAIITTEKLDIGLYGVLGDDQFPQNYKEKTNDIIVHKIGM